MRLFASTLSLLALCVACQSTPDWQHTDSNDVRNSLLAYVPKSDQHAIDQARQERGAIAEELAAAKRDRDATRSRLDLANDDLSVVQMRLREAKNQSDHAERYGDQQEYDKSKHRVDDAEAAVRLARAKVAYYQDMSTLAGKREELLQARGRLANAMFDLAKAEAVSKLDRPIAKQIDVDARRETVHRMADDARRAALEAKVARRRVNLQSDLVAQRREQVPDAFRMNEIASTDTVLSADAFGGFQDQLAEVTGEATPPNRSAPSEAASKPSAPGN